MYTDRDLHFAATLSGIPLESARVAVLSRPSSELGYVQLVAAAVPLVTGFLKKKKAKKRRKREEAAARAQAAAARTPAIATASLSPPTPTRSRRAMRRRPPPSSLRQLALPLAIAGGAIVLVLAMRR